MIALTALLGRPVPRAVFGVGKHADLRADLSNCVSKVLRTALPPGSDRRFRGPACRKQICNRPRSICFHRMGHGEVVLVPPPSLSCS